MYVSIFPGRNTDPKVMSLPIFKLEIALASYFGEIIFHNCKQFYLNFGKTTENRAEKNKYTNMPRIIINEFVTPKIMMLKT